MKEVFTLRQYILNGLFSVGILLSAIIWSSKSDITSWLLLAIVIIVLGIGIYKKMRNDLSPRKKTIFKLFGFLFTAFVIFLFLPTIIGFIPSIDKVNAVFVRDADFESVEFKIFDECKFIYNSQEQGPTQLIHFHRIKAGSGVILAYRRYDQGNRSTIDDESFEKVTIFLSKLVSGKFEFGSESNIRGYYASGASAWERTVCGGELEHGSVEVREGEVGTFKVRIQATLNCERMDATKKRLLSIDIEQTFKEISMTQVTPWIGKWAERYYSEAYPGHE